MKSADYWQKRALADKRHRIVDTEKYLAKQQRIYYSAAEKEIQTEIEGLYQSFADQQQITLAEAKRRISAADFQAVDWDQMVDYAIKSNKDLREAAGSLPAEIAETISKQHKEYEAQLAAYTRKGRITLLQLKQLEIDKTLLDLYDAQQINMYQYLSTEYQDTYYRQIYNVQHGLGFGRDFARINKAAVDRAILNLYPAGNFSGRLYGHCKTFAKEFKEQLTIGLIRGESLDKMATRISRRMGVARSRAKTLVRTETAYVFEAATRQSYREAGVEEYEYLATLDYRTSEICRELDGQVFATKDARPGVNYPPMHPNCRSTTVCHFSDDKVTQRIANSKDAYHVPSDMDYQTWYDTYAAREEPGILQRMARRYDERHDLETPIGLREIPDAAEIRYQVFRNKSQAAQVLRKYYDQIRIVNTTAKGGALYMPYKKALRYNAAHAADDSIGPYATLYHEIGHAIDDLCGRKSELKLFTDALHKDKDALLQGLLDAGVCDKLEETYGYIDQITSQDPSYMAVRDLLGALTDKQIGVSDNDGHEAKYWKRKYALEHEAFAHFFSASLTDNSAGLKSLQQSFPAAWAIFEEVLKSEL